MMQLLFRVISHQEMVAHHSVMTSSLHIKIFKINIFGDFSSDIDFNIRWTNLEILSPL